MSQLVLHIGFRKTGTTFLQQVVFPKMPEVEYFGNMSCFSKLLINNKKYHLISDEGIAGNPYYCEKLSLLLFDQFKLSVQNIKDVVVNPKIIVCFREPSSFLLSNYKQYLHEGGTLSWEDFFSLDDKGLVKVNDLIFSKYLDALFDAFPFENIFAFTYEEFKKDNLKTINEMYSFITDKELNSKDILGIQKRSNPSVPDELESLLIRLNKVNLYLLDVYSVRLQLKMFGKVLNPRILCQYLIPEIWNFTEKRDIEKIKKYYTEDWGKTKELISQSKSKRLSKATK